MLARVGSTTQFGSRQSFSVVGTQRGRWLAVTEAGVGNNRVEPRAIRKTALLTVEGERDDICSIGQTLATHELCSGLRPYRKRHHLQAGTGHYGVFSGKKWETQICPIVRNHILASE